MGDDAGDSQRDRNERADQWFEGPEAGRFGAQSRPAGGISVTEVLYGGPKGEGLVYTVKELARLVSEQSKQIDTLRKLIEGSEGIHAKHKALEGRVEALESRVSTAFKYGWIIIAALAVVGIGTLLIVGHAVNAPLVPGGHG